MNEAENRQKVIVRTSIIGIAANIVLSAFKAFVGFATNSIAVTLDAVNNLSDALSSVITIVGAKLSNKLPDKKHPLGYGRIEYLSAMVVAAIVLYAGGTSAVESVKKIIHPETADYSTASLVIIASAVVVKLVLGKFVKRQGERVNSGALVASGADALFDAILSLSVQARRWRPGQENQGATHRRTASPRRLRRHSQQLRSRQVSRFRALGTSRYHDR